MYTAKIMKNSIMHHCATFHIKSLRTKSISNQLLSWKFHQVMFLHLILQIQTVAEQNLQIFVCVLKQIRQKMLPIG